MDTKRSALVAVVDNIDVGNSSPYKDSGVPDLADTVDHNDFDSILAPIFAKGQCDWQLIYLRLPC